MSLNEFINEVIKYLPVSSEKELTETERNICKMRFNENYTPEAAADSIKYGDWLEEYIYQSMSI